MARYRRYRKYSRRRATRWAPNIVKVSNLNDATIGEFYNTEILAQNPVQANTGVSQTFTVKNFEITFTIEPMTPDAVTSLESITAYIMYVPQGMNVTSLYYAEHPEYIMAYKYLGSPAGTIPYGTSTGFSVRESQQYQPIKIRSRLCRKLQTGDSVILFIQGSNASPNNSSQQYNIDGIVRWWSKAN